MQKLRPLISDQHVRIDNHTPGKPMKWDWDDGEKPDDIHLEKSLNTKIKGKYVKVRITLNNDEGVDVPKKIELKDKEWKNAYEKMLKEVRDTLRNNKNIKMQLLQDIYNSIKEIGPNKQNRAVKKALMRIAKHFDLTDELFVEFKEFTRGTVAFFKEDGQSLHYYVGFGNDDAFYMGEGDGRSFSKRVHRKI